MGMQILVFALLISFASAGRVLTGSSQEKDTMAFQYHNGPLLGGEISVNLIWYGNFKPSQRAIVSDFIASLSVKSQVQPSVAMWWNTIEKYYHLIQSKKQPSLLKLSLGTQILDENYSLGKLLKMQQIPKLAAKGGNKVNSINVVLTSSDVAIEGFCSTKCGSHGSISNKFAFIWVGNSEAQCPGHCAWPFHKPIYGPQTSPLIAPNDDVGVDGMVINLASLLAGTVTNPFGNGYYQGPSGAPLEAASACPGVFGKGAYPGYAGEVLVDASSGASYNANGVNGRKYLLPALYDPSNKSCSTLV